MYRAYRTIWLTIVVLGGVAFFAAAVPDATADIAESYEIRRIGLTGGGYQSAEGYEVTYAQAVNDAGQAIGASTLYQGS